MKKKATSFEALYQERYRSILETYLYALEVGAYVHDLNLGLQSPKRERLLITEAIKELMSLSDKLRGMSDSETLNKIFLQQDHNPGKVLGACSDLIDLIEALVYLSGDSIKEIPIEGLLIEYFDEGKPDLVLDGKRFDSFQTGVVVRQWFRILRLSDKDSLDKSHTEELEIIFRSLPGILAYQNSKEQSKPKKSRNAEAIQKEKDLLYLLDQYESWQAKEAEKTGRKRFNAKEWLQEYDQWKSKAKAIWGKHVTTKSRDGTSQEVDPSSKLAQGRIDSIIKYAQKIKRERSESDE